MNKSQDGNAPQTQEPPVILTATEARQGPLGKPVLYVLISAMILALVAWWAAEYYGSSIAPPSTDKTTTAVKPPGSDEKIINNTPPAGEQTQKAPTIQDDTKP